VSERRVANAKGSVVNLEATAAKFLGPVAMIFSCISKDAAAFYHCNNPQRFESTGAAG